MSDQVSSSAASVARGGRSWRRMATALALTAAAVLSVSALSVSALAQGYKGASHGMGGGHAGMHGMPMGRHLERMLDTVDATEAQRTQIRSISKAAREDLRKLHASSRELRSQAMAVFTQPEVDAAAAEKLRQQMLARHDQASKRMLQAMLDVSRVLTPQQRAQLGERMKQREERWRQRMEERREDGLNERQEGFLQEGFLRPAPDESAVPAAPATRPSVQRPLS